MKSGLVVAVDSPPMISGIQRGHEESFPWSGSAPIRRQWLLAFGVWSLTARLVGRSFIHYLWRLPLCAYAFGAPLGIVAQLIFGQRGDLLHRDTAEPERHPSPRKDR